LATFANGWSAHVLLDRILLAGHVAALAVALLLAVFWPRPGEPALLLPMTTGPQAALAWAEREGAPFLSLDTRAARIVARVPSDASLARALAAGVLPLSAEATGCTPAANGDLSWKS
jgi:hypothetical protein